jgi:small subunit ribosomal protein S17
VTDVERGKRKTREGVVVSDKMEKTVVVMVERIVQHPKYKKRLKRRVRVKAHDEQNQCRVGDRVVIAETRPLSRDKRWAIRTVVEKAR